MKRRKHFYKNKKILVTGGAGFIGSHIAETLVLKGAHVTILDDLSSGFLANLESFRHHITFFAGDITNFDTCYKATKSQDIVFHLAAFISVPESFKYPKLCEKINIEGTQNLLECCKEHNVQSFVFSSSSAIYGQRKDTCDETDIPNPQSPYASSKLVGEKLCNQFANEMDMNIACLRYFNVYGERQNPNGAYAGVVAKFKQNLLRKNPITIYGNGKQKRDFVPVSNVVNANLLTAKQRNLRGDLFNVGTGTSITLLDLVEKLEKDIDLKNIGLKFEPAREGDIFCSQANCEKFKTLQNTII